MLNVFHLAVCSARVGMAMTVRILHADRWRSRGRSEDTDGHITRLQ